MIKEPIMDENPNTPIDNSIVNTLSESDPEESQLDEKDSKDDTRFKDGQPLRLVRVRFPGNSRSFPFLIGKRRIEYGQKVVAMSDRGMAVGYINSFPYEVAFNKSMLPLRSISKVANQEDIDHDMAAYRQQKSAENICNDLIERYQLDMQLTHVEFTSFGKKAVFYFIAPARVDFRDLVKDLVAKLKTRIELRQISVRDRSASIGGIGPCGRELCCSSFLTKYGNVGIKMAKNQDLTLNFSKLNGVCGQLKCCLQYEDEVYREKRSRLPKEGDIISTHTGEIGRVDRLHLLSEQFVMMTNKGIRKRFMVDLYKETLDRSSINFPQEFDSISDETHKVIGLDEHQAKKIQKFETEINELKSESKVYADKAFEELFGLKTFDYNLPQLPELESQKNQIKIPDEEEEIQYTPSADEMLPEDEEEEGLRDFEPVQTRMESNDGYDRRPRQQNQSRNHSGPRQDSQRNSRDRNQNRPRGGESNADRKSSFQKGPRPSRDRR